MRRRRWFRGSLRSRLNHRALRSHLNHRALRSHLNHRTGSHLNQRGQTAVLIIGFAVAAVMMVAVVVDASAAFLRRGGLDSLADGAALAAADGIEGRQVYEGGLDRHAKIDPAVARQLVDDYLRATQAARRYPGLSYEVDASAERVVVRVAAPLRLPITPPGWDRRPSIRGTASTFVLVSD